MCFEIWIARRWAVARFAMEIQKKHTQRSAASIDWPIFSSKFGRSCQNRAYEPISMFQVVSFAECDMQIDDRSMNRTSENFGIAERGLFRSRRANTWERCLGWNRTDWYKFYGQICRIWDSIVRILIFEASELHDIALSKYWFFRHSGACQDRPMCYWRSQNNRHCCILFNFERPHFL